MKDTQVITEQDIKDYFELYRSKKQIDEEMNRLKKKFHQFLDHTVGKDNKGEITRGNYKIQRQIRKTIKYDDQLTVNKLEELNLQDFIINVKQADTEKLESAISLGFVTKDEFEDCKNTKLTKTIVVKEIF